MISASQPELSIPMMDAVIARAILPEPPRRQPRPLESLEKKTNEKPQWPSQKIANHRGRTP
jgi:hypothetical protein